MRLTRLCFVAVLCGIAFAEEPKATSTETKKEPVYRGRALSEWVAFAKCKEVKDPKQPLPLWSIHMIAALGPRAEKAIPDLAELAKGEDLQVSGEATWALSEIGPKAVPALAELLGCPNRFVRCNVAVFLSHVNPNSPETSKGVRVVTELLAAPDYRTRESAAYALGRIGHQAKSAVPAISALLDDQKGLVRIAAATALWHIVPNSSETKAGIKAMLNLMPEKDERISWLAWLTLKNMGPDASIAVPGLIKMLQDNKKLRGDAGQVLVAIGPAAVAPVTQLLSDKRAEVRNVAITTLREMGPVAKASVPEIIPLIHDSDPMIRFEAVWALGEIGPAARTAVPALTKLLKDSSLRVTAVESLGKIAADAEAVVPELVKLLDDEHSFFRYRVAQALGNYGRKAKVAVPKFRELLHDKDEPVRYAVADGLGKIGPDAKSSIVDLAAALDDEDELVRAGAACSLGSFGSEADMAIAPLEKLLASPGMYDRCAAARALDDIGPDAKAAIPALTKLLGDEFPNVRQAAAVSLGKLGSLAKSAVPALTALLEDKEGTDQESVVKALAKIKGERPKEMEKIP